MFARHIASTRPYGARTQAWLLPLPGEDRREISPPVQDSGYLYVLFSHQKKDHMRSNHDRPQTRHELAPIAR